MFLVKKNIGYTLCALILAVAFSTNFAHGSANNIVEGYIADLESSSHVQRLRAAKNITRSGLTDTKLFDTVKDILLAGYLKEPDNNTHTEEMSWMCKALASSGNINYLQALNVIAADSPSRKIQKYAKESIQQITYYRDRIEIAQSLTVLPKGMSEDNMKLMKMIQTGNLRLMKEAARTLTDRRIPDPDPRLYDMIENKLREGYTVNTKERNHLDTMAWFCKALGASGDTKFRIILEEVSNSSKAHPKLKKYAIKSLDLL
ncbi:MAG: hypothetical protein OEM02_08785 [Desulfobulbaceae bacterium]|nr:hypothetical protein [Desulfobulbaceae bacterium]